MVLSRYIVLLCYGNDLQVIGLHDFCCNLHVAAWSLTPL